MSAFGSDRAWPMRAAWVRALMFFGLWLMLAEPYGDTGLDLTAGRLADLAVGAFAAAAATWVSLRLLPAAPGRRIRPGAILRLIGRFLWQSVAGGVDVALRVFAPRPRLRPGYLAYSMLLPPGPARAGFGALTSLVPGTLPIGTDREGRLIYHCLDREQPIAQALAADETLLIRALNGGLPHD